MTPDAVVVAPMSDALTGSIRVPGDKSVSHRAFMLAAHCDAPVRVSGAAASEDVAATVAALRLLGAEVDGRPTEASVRGPLREPDDVLDCGNSGTAMRLLAGVCAGIDALSVLTGDRSLRSRPMARIAEPLRRMGARVDGRASGARAPLAIRGGGLRGVTCTLPVASAQVKSCLLLAGLRADGRTRVVEPGPSRDHTERMLAWLGADVTVEEGAVSVGPSALRARPLQVPADLSAAAFWLVAGSVRGGEITLPDVGLNPTRTGVLDVLRAMGALVRVDGEREWSGEPVADLTVRAVEPGAGEVHGDLVVRAIDELPVLAVAGALGGGLVVRDASELRVKESDRIEGIARLLRTLGGDVETTSDGFRVRGGTRFRGGRVDSGGDHRIAMAGAVAGLCAREPVTITGFRCVTTSYPSFLDDLTALGATWRPQR